MHCLESQQQKVLLSSIEEFLNDPTMDIDIIHKVAVFFFFFFFFFFCKEICLKITNGFMTGLF